MLPGTGHVKRGPEMAVMRLQVGPDVNKEPHALRASFKRMGKDGNHE